MKKNSGACVFGIITGAIIIILGAIVLFADYPSNSFESMRFGGDFYTEIYKVTRGAAVNTGSIVSVLKTGIGFLLFAIGGTDICWFSFKLNECNKESDDSNVQIVTETKPSDVPEDLPEL